MGKGETGSGSGGTPGSDSTRFNQRRQAMGTAHPRAWQFDVEVEADLAVLYQDHPIGNGHGFADVVGHQQYGETMLLPKALDQLLHFDPGQGIQRSQRFVEQQQSRAVNQGAGQGHALFLATGQARALDRKSVV